MIDFKKFVKYSRPGPRYTSYPTAPEFSDAFGYDDYLDALRRTNESGRPLSLYFHLPFCRSACYFCGCNVVYTSKEEKKERYVDYLFREMEILKGVLDCSRPVLQLHFGGGTPTFFSAGQLKEIIQKIRETFPNFMEEAEVSCEIDPRFFTEEQMKVLKEGGFNRISFGMQDFDEKVQEATHRIQPLKMTEDAVKLARKYDVDSVNADLIYGLPHQTLETFKDTLEKTVAMDPDRLAVFNYAHVPWMKKSMRKIDETTLPDPEVKLQIMRFTIDYLTSNGYRMIGMDHFAKESDELFQSIGKNELHRNFQGYTTKGGSDLVGVGVTSIGEGPDFYAQNLKEMADYEAAIDAGRLPLERGILLSDDDRLRKRVIMRLMSNFSLEFAAIEEEFGIDFRNYFTQELKALEPFREEALLTLTDTGIQVGETGRLLIRNIAMPFDAYLKKIPDEKRRFSKTV